MSALKYQFSIDSIINIRYWVSIVDADALVLLHQGICSHNTKWHVVTSTAMVSCKLGWITLKKFSYIIFT